MIYGTSDNHFGHRKIIEYEKRPFESVDDMNRKMIDNWNRVVEPDDYVIHFGDFSLESPQVTIEICQALQGKIILINGNHDHRTRTFWEDRAGILKWFKKPQYVSGIWLCHSPFGLDIKSDDIVYHGHKHGKIRRDGNYINFGVDAWNFFPVPLPWADLKSYEKINIWIRSLENE